jgi:two-component system nitrogen regulation response regulator GlnG
MQFLSALDLPGNVRQLENLCNWITVMAPGQTVEVKDLPAELIQSTGTVALTTPSPEPLSVVKLNGDHHMPTSVMPEPAHTNGESSANGIMQDRHSWLLMLEAEASHMLSSGRPEVMDALGRQFEAALIKTALKHTHGRKNDAAVRLGIGRNTITRKIQELGIEGIKDD